MEGDSGESSEGVEDGGDDSGNLAGIEDFSEIDEVMCHMYARLL